MLRVVCVWSSLVCSARRLKKKCHPGYRRYLFTRLFGEEAGNYTRRTQRRVDQNRAFGTCLVLVQLVWVQLVVWVRSSTAVHRTSRAPREYVDTYGDVAILIRSVLLYIYLISLRGGIPTSPAREPVQMLHSSSQ